MKRLLALLLALSALALPGCSGVYTNYREMEQLLVLQTMGIDLGEDGGVVLTLASAAASGRDGAPVRLRLTGATLASAIERAQSRAFEEALFFAHISALVLGEEYAKRGAAECVDYISQSPLFRMDLPIYIVKDGTAEQTLLSVGDGEAGISELLRGVREYYDVRGDGSVYTLSDFTRDTLRHGSALVCALELTPSSRRSPDSSPSPGADEETGQSAGTEDTDTDQSDSADEALTAAAAGYAVLRDMRLCAYIDPEDALGVNLLKNTVGQSDVTLKDEQGNAVTLRITDGGCSITPRRTSNGALSRMDISARVEATILEADGAASFNDSAYIDRLTAQLESYVSGKLSGVLHLAGQLEADFAALGAAVQRRDPTLYALSDKPFYELLPALELRVSVTGLLTHSNDTRLTVSQERAS